MLDASSKDNIRNNKNHTEIPLTTDSSRFTNQLHIMSTSNLPNVPSLRRQQLLLEFASLKHAAPPGVYMTLSPGDPSLWTGVIFVRSGPYASAILRLQIRFPSSYPDHPPLVTFSTDVFHPLIVPLTTYTFSTGSGNEDTISAADKGRLPPGGFSLRHGFPHWFRGVRTTERNRNGINENRDVKPVDSPQRGVSRNGSRIEREEGGSSERRNTPVGQGDDTQSPKREDDKYNDNENRREKDPVPTIPVAELLDYIRSTFDNESILDSLPLEAAGNPGAWHAWRAHRHGGRGGGRSTAGHSSPFSKNSKSTPTRGSPQTRLPGDWHWDGIWTKRARDEVEVSRSEATLFGGAGRGGNAGDEMIRFSRLDDAALASIKQMMIPQVHTEEAYGHK